MTSTDRTARIVGSIRATEDGKGAVRMEDVYDTDIDDLWSALTDPSRLARWVAEVDGELREGGHFHARFTSQWEGPGQIDVCQRPHLLRVTTAPGTPDGTVIEATLATEGDKTRLVVEERGIPFDDLPYHGAGWQAHVEDLTAHLAGQPAGDWQARWKLLTPAYLDLAAGVSVSR